MGTRPSPKFEPGCPYRSGSDRGMPMFRLCETLPPKTSNLCSLPSISVRDSYGDGDGEDTFIEQGLTNINCSHACSCHRLDKFVHFSFYVHETAEFTTVTIIDRRLYKCTAKAIGRPAFRDPQIPMMFVWDLHSLLAGYDSLRDRLQSSLKAPENSEEAALFPSLRLLVDGFLKPLVPGADDSPSCPLADFLETVHSEPNANVTNLESYNTTFPTASQVPGILAADQDPYLGTDLPERRALRNSVFNGASRLPESIVCELYEVPWVGTSTRALTRADLSYSCTWDTESAKSELSTEYNSASSFSLSYLTKLEYQQSSDARPQSRDIFGLKQDLRSFNAQLFNKILHQPIKQYLENSFSNPTRAWQLGLATLRKISKGYVPCDVGEALAFLCVCSSIASTLDKSRDHPSSRISSNAFEADLPRWFRLFKKENHLFFVSAALNLWQCRSIPAWAFFGPSPVDYPELLRNAQKILLEFETAMEQFFEPAISGRANQHLELDHRHQHPFSSSSSEPRLRDLYRISGSRKRMKNADEIGEPGRMSLLWAYLLTGAIFTILISFLLWLNVAAQSQVQGTHTQGHLPPYSAQRSVSNMHNLEENQLSGQATPPINPVPQYNMTANDGLSSAPSATQGHQEIKVPSDYVNEIDAKSTNGLTNKVFECTICPKRFSRKDNAARHCGEQHSEYFVEYWQAVQRASSGS